jgi:UDP-N-acetylmuramate dehydrogenase
VSAAAGPEFDGIVAHLHPVFGDRVERDAPLAPFTTYRLGGPAAVLARVGSPDELAALAEARRAVAPVPVTVIGRGSNLVVADAGVAAVVVLLDGEYEAVEVGDGAARSGAAVALPVLARRLAAAGRAGLEFYVGIPGTVGGAVRMNAGGHGRSTAEVLLDAAVADLDGDGSVGVRPVGDLGLGYRHSALGPAEVVVGARFAVTGDEPEACEARLAEIVRWRREHQPGGANAGSVFRNPDGDSAGRLIEATGLKGMRVGGAVVSGKHANFIQAEAGAAAADVAALVALVQERVEAATGVRLETELHWLGFDPADR